MQLIFHPMRSDAVLELVRDGDRLSLNGESFDFSPLPEGSALPRGAIASPWIAGEIRRQDRVLRIPLILPLARNAPPEAAFAPPLTLAGDGPVLLPGMEQGPHREAARDQQAARTGGPRRGRALPDGGPGPAEDRASAPAPDPARPPAPHPGPDPAPGSRPDLHKETPDEH